MPQILDADFLMYKALVNDDTINNGGRQSANVILDATPRSLLEDLDAADLLAGLTRWRKLFFQIETSGAGVQADNLSVFLEELFAGDGEGYITNGTHIDTQNDLSSPTLWGAGIADATITAGVSSFDVAVEDGATIIFRDTEEIWLSNGVDSEFITINGVPVVNADVVTITTLTPVVNTYAAGSKVASLMPYASILASSENYVLSNPGMSLDDAQVVTDALGTIYQNWTITFDTTTAFTLDGDTLGAAYDTGNTLSAFSPANPDINPVVPLFTIPAGAWGGSPQIGDTVTFRTVPASVPVWLKMLIPAATTAVPGTKFKLGVRYNSTL